MDSCNNSIFDASQCLSLCIFIKSNANKRSKFWRFRGRGKSRHYFSTSHSSIDLSVILDNPSVALKRPTALAKQPKFSPFPGWLHYFSTLPYESDSTAAKYTEVCFEFSAIFLQAFVDYIKHECLSETSENHPPPSFIDWAAIEERPIVNIDFASLRFSPTLAEKLPVWPPLPNAERRLDSKLVLLSLGLAVHTVATEKLYGINTNLCMLMLSQNCIS